MKKVISASAAQYLVATLIDLFRSLDAGRLLEAGKKGGRPEFGLTGREKQKITRRE